MFTQQQLEAFLLWELADALIHKEDKLEKVITKRLLKTEVFPVFTNVLINVKEFKKIDYLISVVKKNPLAENCASIIDAQFLHFDGGTFFNTDGYGVVPKVQEKRKPRVIIFSLTKTEAEINGSNFLSALPSLDFKGVLSIISLDKEPGLMKAADLLGTIKLRGDCTDKKLAKLRAKLVV
ncbi:MAG: hypothetical protein WCG55_02810 [bacterium]